MVSSRTSQGSGEKLVAAACTLLNELYPPRQQAVTPHEKITLFNGRDLAGTPGSGKTGIKILRTFSMRKMVRFANRAKNGAARRMAITLVKRAIAGFWCKLGEDGAYSSTWLESMES